MTIFANKVLWVEDLDDHTDEDRIFDHARAMGEEAVVIRTISGRLATSNSKLGQGVRARLGRIKAGSKVAELPVQLLTKY